MLRDSQVPVQPGPDHGGLWEYGYNGSPTETNRSVEAGAYGGVGRPAGIPVTHP